MSPSRIIRFPFLLLIRMYQATHGAFFQGVCRFHPTCSHYALEAIETRGLGMGLLLSAWRILRCQPFCKGGWDPVPTSRADFDLVPERPAALRPRRSQGARRPNAALGRAVGSASFSIRRVP